MDRRVWLLGEHYFYSGDPRFEEPRGYLSVESLGSLRVTGGVEDSQ